MSQPFFIVDTAADLPSTARDGLMAAVLGTGLVYVRLAGAWTLLSATALAPTVAAAAANAALVAGTYVRATGGGPGITLTLPAATAGNIGKQITVKKVDAGAGAITVAAAGSDTVDGAASVVLDEQYQSITLIQATATAWELI